MFRIKICGITNVDDGLAAAEAGADALGLNFYPKSPRYIRPELARRIVDALPAVVKVGLFVNTPAADVCGLFDQLGLELIQVHGDEPPEFLVQLGGRPAMRAFRMGPARLEPILAYLEQCRWLGCLPRSVLIDSHQKGVYGGTGKTADWAAVADYPSENWYPPLVLAGGLTPENVAQAIRTVRPAAVDTASGVESGPGKKDCALLTAFVRTARDALQNL